MHDRQGTFFLSMAALFMLFYAAVRQRHLAKLWSSMRKYRKKHLSTP